MKITLAEIARRANVSSMTVSRVLNQRSKGQVSPEKIEEILTLAGELGYRRHEQNLPSGGDLPVTLLLAEESYTFAPDDEAGQSGFTQTEMLNGVIGRAAQLDVRLEVIPCGSTPESNWKRLDHLRRPGRVLALSNRLAAELYALTGRGCRIGVCSDESFHLSVCHAMCPDGYFGVARTRHGANQATRRLFETGYRRIAVLAYEQRMHEPAYPRVTGYLEALRHERRAYRNIIAVRGFSVLRERIGQEYERDPFDALLFHAPGGSWTRSGTLQSQLGVPDTVRIVNYIGSPEYPDLPGMIYPWRKIGSDALDALCSGNFTGGERTYPGMTAGF